MTTEALFRGFFALLLAGALAVGIFLRDDWDESLPAPRRRARQLSPLVAPYLLPFFLVLLFTVVAWTKGLHFTFSTFFFVFFDILLSLSVYYVALALLLPLLRRWISAKVCAWLWLLPNFLYLTHYTFMQPAAPRWVWKLSNKLFFWALAVWAAGFAAVLLWKVAGHLVFRRRLLRDAQRVTDPAVLELWQQAQRAVDIKKPKLRLMTAPGIATPLSVGCFRFAIRVVLPEGRHYTPEELRLIFRHELVHIQRLDGWTKFFLSFCTALCWFNPLMWLAMRRSAEDLELSCDELALSEADEAGRKLYAELLLRSAADGRGFTTCLSATAKALRYRLENVLRPRKRMTGSLVASVLFFALLLSGGHIALAYSDGTAAEEVFGDGTLSDYSVYHVNAWQGGDPGSSFVCRDEHALTEYLASLELYRLSGGYSFDRDDGNELTIICEGPHGNFGLRLVDHLLTVTPLYGDERGQQRYYLDEALDWDYLFSLLEEAPRAPRPEQPRLLLHFRNEGVLLEALDGEPLEASRQTLSKIVDGEETVRLSPKPEPAGASVLSGVAVTEVELGWPIMPEHYTVTVEDVESGSTYTVDGAALENYILPLAPYSARYSVEAFFLHDGAEHTIRFLFDVELP